MDISKREFRIENLEGFFLHSDIQSICRSNARKLSYSSTN